MTIASPARKVFFGCADRRQMFRLFDRHAQRPNRWDEESSHLYAGEWFEIGSVEHDYMLDVLPPLWMRPGMFAMRECLTGSVTSVFFTLPIGDRVRHFHGYCDLAEQGSPERLRDAITAREATSPAIITRAEKLEHIWSATHDDYRGYAGSDWPAAIRGKRTIMVYGARGSTLKLLDALTDDEIAAKLPVQLRVLPDTLAA